MGASSILVFSIYQGPSFATLCWKALKALKNRRKHEKKGKLYIDQIFVIRLDLKKVHVLTKQNTIDYQKYIANHLVTIFILIIACINCSEIWRWLILCLIFNMNVIWIIQANGFNVIADRSIFQSCMAFYCSLVGFVIQIFIFSV